MAATANTQTPSHLALTQDRKGMAPRWGDRHFASSLRSLGLRIADALEMSPQMWKQTGGASTFPGPLPNPHQNLIESHLLNLTFIFFPKVNCTSKSPGKHFFNCIFPGLSYDTLNTVSGDGTPKIKIRNKPPQEILIQLFMDQGL